MNRWVQRLGFILVLSLLSFTTTAAAAKYTLGQDYTALPKSLLSNPLVARNTESGKVVVTEFFSYACPACNAVAGNVRSWKKALPNDVTFQRVPVEFHKEWAIFTRAFYTAEALGILDKIDAPMFNAVHKQRRDLSSPSQMKQFFVEQGVSAQDFDKTFHSFGVDKSIEMAKMLMQTYKVYAVPAMIVDNHYTTDLKRAKSLDGFTAVTDHMIEQSRHTQ